MPAGSAVVVDPDRERARNPAAHSPGDTRTFPLNTGEAAARRRSNVSTACSTLSAAETSCSPAALRRNPSGKRSNKFGPLKAASNAANRRAMVGWLNPSARPAARIEPSRATARNTRTSSQSMAPRLDPGGRSAALCPVSPAGTVAAALRSSATQRAASTNGMQSRMPSIIDLNAEVAKLKMFRRTPNSTAADRKGSVARLASYRDGLLLAIKASGKDHWERHLTGDELIHILDGTATLEIVCDHGPPRSFELHAGMIAVIPQGAWHHFLYSEDATQMAATPFPGEDIELDVDDPREVEWKPT